MKRLKFQQFYSTFSVMLIKLITYIVIKICSHPNVVLGISSYWLVTTAMPSFICSSLFCIPNYMTKMISKCATFFDQSDKKKVPLFIHEDNTDIYEATDMELDIIVLSK